MTVTQPKFGWRDLNPAQRAAIKALWLTPVLVLAGAGTGKTHVLTNAVRYLVLVKGVSPRSILLLTFTNKAADEMRWRAGALVGLHHARVRASTFHSFALRLLRRHGSLVGLAPKFSILDASDVLTVLKALVRQLGLDRTRLPKPSRIASIFSFAANQRVKLRQALERRWPEYLPALPLFLKLQRAYRAYKTRHCKLDFDDLLVAVVRLFQTRPAVLAKLRRTYRWVLVDEYQDTSVLQAEVLRLLTGDSPRVMVVGDDAQAIYTWRGASFDNLHQFVRDRADATVVKLEQNYRSRQPILDVANALMAHMPERFRKTLVAVRSGGDLPRLVSFDNHQAEARGVVERVHRLVAQGLELGDIGVLFRNSRDAWELESELDRQRVPYDKFGGLKFRDAKHVRDVLAHLIVLVNPTDHLAWLRILNLLDGVGKHTAAQVYAEIEHGKPLAQAVARVRRREAQASLTALIELLVELEALGDAPTRLTHLVVTYYEKLAESHSDRDLRKDLARLVTLSKRFHTLRALLDALALEAPEDRGRTTAKNRRQRLVLSTVHSAKGREWKRVFILRAEDEVFPSVNAITDEQYEEERRVFYVAVTRARDGLVVSWSRRQALSPFVADPQVHPLFKHVKEE